MRILLLAVLILCQASVFAQTKKFRWMTELCEFEGTYDSKKYTPAQLRDTWKLLSLGYFPNTIDPTPDKYAGIKTLSVDTLNKEYQARTNALKRLNIIKTKYWVALRQRHLKELEQVFQLSRATILGYADPAKLREITFADACVNKYVNPLIAGGDSLIAIWREVNEETRKNNASPERIKSIFDSQFNSPEKFQYAQVEVMRFGWWNCANSFIDREDRYEENEREFRKLFNRTRTISCDQP
jgi:hypothetical protein